MSLPCQEEEEAAVWSEEVPGEKPPGELRGAAALFKDRQCQPQDTHHPLFPLPFSEARGDTHRMERRDRHPALWQHELPNMLNLAAAEIYRFRGTTFPLDRLICKSGTRLFSRALPCLTNSLEEKAGDRSSPVWTITFAAMIDGRLFHVSPNGLPDFPGTLPASCWQL